MNSKERRTLRRLIKEAGIQPVAQAQEPTVATRSARRSRSRHWLSLAWKILIFAVGVPGLYIGILSVLPRLSLSPGDFLNQGQPLSFPIVVSNDGYLGIHDGTAECEISKIVTESDVTVENSRMTSSALTIGDLDGGARTTIICNPSKDVGLIFGNVRYRSAEIAIAVTFRPDFLPWHVHRRFPFRGAISDDGQIHWTPSNKKN